MNDKERLGEIETKYSTLTVSSEKNGTEYTEVDVEDLVFLIQNGFKQAERADKNAQDLEDMDRQLYSEQQQNKRYREALNNIYELAEYDEYDSILEQIISEVEKALEGTK